MVHVPDRTTERNLMDGFSAFAVVIVFALLFGLPMWEAHQKAKSETRIAAWRHEMDELTDAIDEYDYWQRHGRPKPHRYHGWVAIEFGGQTFCARYDCDRLVDTEIL